MPAYSTAAARTAASSACHEIAGTFVMSSGIPLVDDFAADNRREHSDVLDARRLDAEDVLAEDHHVGELAARERPLLAFLEFGEGRSAGVGGEGDGHRGEGRVLRQMQQRV